MLRLVTCFTPCMVLRMNKVNISETSACGFLMLQAVLLLASTTQEEISTIFKTFATVEFVF